MNQFIDELFVFFINSIAQKGIKAKFNFRFKSII